MMKNTAALALVLVSIAACGEPLGDRSITVDLSYDDGSNYGPEDATGTAYIETGTGLVEIQVEGLPTLTDEVYEGWLSGGGEDAISTGRFNTDEEGVGGSSIVLGDISERTFERVVLTIEPDPDPSKSPDSRHSIGGFIPTAE